MKPHRSRFRLHAALILCIAAALPATCMFAQTKHAAKATPRSALCTPAPSPFTQTAPPTHPPLLPCPAKHHTDTSISLGIFPQLTIDRTGDLYGFTEQGTAPSTGILGTFRQTFSPWLGYSVNLGYSRVSEQYRDENGGSGFPANLNVNSNMYESSITYIAHTRVNKRISLFGDAGPALLTFLPVPGSSNPSGLSVQVRPTGLFGSGVDVRLSRSFDLRGEYRGLIYDNPDFRTGDFLSKRLTLTNEPTISLVYNFHAGKARTPSPAPKPKPASHNAHQ